MSMADRDGWIWYDGKMVPWRDATTHVLTHTRPSTDPRSSVCVTIRTGFSALRTSTG